MNAKSPEYAAAVERNRAESARRQHLIAKGLLNPEVLTLAAQKADQVAKAPDISEKVYDQSNPGLADAIEGLRASYSLLADAIQTLGEADRAKEERIAALEARPQNRPKKAQPEG